MSNKKRLYNILAIVFGPPVLAFLIGYFLLGGREDTSGFTTAGFLVLGIVSAVLSLIAGVLVSLFTESLIGYWLPPVLLTVYVLFSVAA